MNAGFCNGLKPLYDFIANVYAFNLTISVDFHLILSFPAWFFGDPHIVTLDGFFYTFNGIGEYVFIQSDILDIQIRAVQARVRILYYFPTNLNNKSFVIIIVIVNMVIIY